MFVIITEEINLEWKYFVVYSYRAKICIYKGLKQLIKVEKFSGLNITIFLLFHSSDL